MERQLYYVTLQIQGMYEYGSTAKSSDTPAKLEPTKKRKMDSYEK